MRRQLDKIKLNFMLSMVPLLLRNAVTRNTPQRVRLTQLLSEAPFVFQISTLDGAGGYFELRNGTLRFHRGTHRNPDLSQTWRGASDAVSVLASRDESLMLRSLEEGSCRLSGRFAVGLWFNEMMKLTRPDRRGSR
ncbi:hypothetical protein E2553_43050 [Paraburkholderia dipogonis]|uniref:SCP2 domain-containing protein n=1 Tax=Paraburkholderia dipogonis TaxID=1211383 RepID=A0A4Y8MGI7_9BURK|nr:hypothetical protein [Paraburkholderia dipogonis]TFE36515.1 hypothetical protein E2553_43050 [Paraburkholderia dipogonis]